MDLKKLKKIMLLGTVIVLVSLVVFTAIEISKVSSSRLSNNNPRISYNNHKYKMGENVFILGYGLTFTDIGSAKVIDPHGDLIMEIPFDGSKTSFVKNYFTPTVSPGECGLEKLVGIWSIKFNGSKIPDDNFEIINQTLPGMEEKYLSGCNLENLK